MAGMWLYHDDFEPMQVDIKQVREFEAKGWRDHPFKESASHEIPLPEVAENDLDIPPPPAPKPAPVPMPKNSVQLGDDETGALSPEEQEAKDRAKALRKLRSEAKAAGIRGYSKMGADELQEQLMKKAEGL